MTSIFIEIFNFNLGINTPNISNTHWIYYPEQIYPFYRIGFPHLFAQRMTPTNCSSLYGELAYINQDSATVQSRTAHAIAQAKQLLNITDADIVTECIIDIPHAYVLYTPWRDTHLPNLLKTLEEQSVYCAGRYAQWKYASMQEAVLDGKHIAEQLLTQKLNTLWKAAVIPQTQSYKETHT